MYKTIINLRHGTMRPICAPARFWGAAAMPVAKAAATLLIATAVLFLSSCARYRAAQAEKKAIALIQAYEQEIAPLDKGVTTAEFEAAQGSMPYVYERLLDLRTARAMLLSDQTRFQTVERWFHEKTFSDPYIARQINRIYYHTLICQTDTATLKRMIRLETYLFEQVVRALSEQTSPPRPISFSSAVKDSMIALARYRNAVVRPFGFENYFHYRTAFMDMDRDSLEVWYHTFDTLTQEPYRRIKTEIDRVLSSRFRLPEKELRYCHYQSMFLYNAFNLCTADQVMPYENKNVVNLATGFYESLGLYVRDVFLRSDLRPREGKARGSHCYDIDSRGELRLLCNLEPNVKSMSDVLYQGSQALYRKNISPTLPYLLRRVDASVMTEGVGQVFRLLPFNATWMQGMGLIYEPTNSPRSRFEAYVNRYARQLMLGRINLSTYHLERALYQNPDQDLDSLWHELGVQYQDLPDTHVANCKTDENSWTARWHILIYPCQYLHYVLGSAVACQLNLYICDSILNTSDYWTPNYMSNEKIGEFFKYKIFWEGDAYPWYEILERATGKPFSWQGSTQWLINSESYAGKLAEEDKGLRTCRNKYFSCKK